MIRGCDWVGFFLLAFVLTSFLVALPPWLLMLSVVTVFYNQQIPQHLAVRIRPCLTCDLYNHIPNKNTLFCHIVFNAQDFSDLIGFLDSVITCVLALCCGVVLVWAAAAMCRSLVRKERKKKPRDRERVDSKQVSLLQPVVRI